MWQSSLGQSRLTRRSLIVMGGIVSTGSLLAACGGSTAETPAASTTTTASTTTSSSSSGQSPTQSSSPVATKSAAATTAAPATKGGQVVIGYAQEQLTLDPAVLNSASQSRMLNSVLDPLVWQMKAGEFTPGLALSWEITPDAMSYVFKLRDGVKFHDDTPFDADAVKASFDRVADPALKALLIGLLGPYDKTEVTDSRTVKVTFKETFPLFLNNLSATGIRPVSPTAAKKFGAEFGVNLVGSGPFKLKTFGPDAIVFERFDAYNWAPAALNHTGPAYLDSITFRIIKEDSTRVIAYDRGEAQVIDFTPPQEVKRLKEAKGNQVDAINVPGLPQMLQLNVTTAPTTEKEVRQAMQYAVDHQAIVDNVWFGVAKAAYGIMSSSTPGYWDGGKTMYPFDPAKAASVLEAAGWKKGSDGIREKNGKRLSVLYVTTADTPNNRTAELVQAMYKDVGIEMKVNAMTNQASKTVYAQNEYNIGRLGEIEIEPSTLEFPLHTRNITGGTQGNRSKYSNPKVDELLDQARKETNWEKRLSMYVDVQKIAVDDAIIIGQWEQVLINTVSTKLSGLSYDPLARMFFHAASLTK